jgi:thiamine-monophosphate kinase
MNEAQFISKLVKLTNGNPKALSLMDDTATLGSGTIVNTDTTIEGVHILHGLNPKYIAYKAMARSVSDIFAKGGEVIGYFLNIILPKGFSAFDDFLQGFAEFTAVHKMDLLGGDTSVYGSDLIIIVTVIAKVEKQTPRFNAKIGDSLCLTKKIGTAYLGLLDCKNGNTTTANAVEYLMPSLVSVDDVSAINASMDISDGLLTDASKMAMASKKHFEIDFNLLPFACGNNFQQMLNFGDDYNILMTSPINIANAVKIGIVKEGSGVKFLNAPSEIQPNGFDHFTHL